MTRRVGTLLLLASTAACSVDATGLGSESIDDALDGSAGETLLDGGDASDPGDAGADETADTTSGDGGDDATDALAPDASPDAIDAADAREAGDATDALLDAADAGTPDVDTCGDGVQDGDESDVDCGGHCAKCANGNRCRTGVDCGSTACTAVGICVPVGCANGVLDPGESDVDCGVACGRGCTAGKHCSGPADCGGRVCNSNVCGLATSCDQILAGDPTAPSTTYPLASTRTGATSPWNTYCAMIGSGVDAGGWTLVLKASKASPTFAYDSALWTDTNLLAGSPDLAPGEAKLEGFLSLAVHAVRVGVTSGTAATARYVMLTMPTSGLPGGLTYPPASLGQLLATNTYVATSGGGRAAWLDALPGSALQKNCNREGLNVVAGAMSVRIGILGNEQGNCDTPDSRLGVGGAGSSCGTNASTRHGDVCACTCYDVSGGTPSGADVPAQAFVFVR